MPHGERLFNGKWKRAYIGAVACPRSIKLGVLVEIDGQNLECTDRTAKEYNHRFDIFVGYGKEAHEKALKLGIKEMKIKIYN